MPKPPARFPDRGEIVLVKITRVLRYGAFAELLDYPGPQAFIHISQVATSWVKNIRNHVKENQVRVALVQGIDRGKNQVDLSLAKVSERVERETIEAWRAAKRSRKLFEVLAKRTKTPFETLWRQAALPLEEAHGSVMEGLRAIALQGTQALDTVPAKWRQPLQRLAQENIKVRQRTVRGVFTLRVPGPDGAARIRKAFAVARKKTGSRVAMAYAGGGRYTLAATAHDFKQAAEALEQARRTVEEALKKASATVAFEKTS